MNIDRQALRVAAMFTGVLVGPVAVAAWWAFPGRPIAWISLCMVPVAFGFAYLVSLDGAELHFDRLHAWYRTKPGRSALRVVYFVLGMGFGVYALSVGSWIAGALSVAAFVSMK